MPETKKQKNNFKQVSIKTKKLLSSIEKLMFEYRYMKTTTANNTDRKKIKWLCVFLKIFFFIFGSFDVRLANIPIAINKAIIQ